MGVHGRGGAFTTVRAVSTSDSAVLAYSEISGAAEDDFLFRDNQHLNLTTVAVIRSKTTAMRGIRIAIGSSVVDPLGVLSAGERDGLF